MKLPLPKDTLSVLVEGKHLLNASNLGLVINKYVFAWSDSWGLDDKTKFFEKITDIKAYKTTGNNYIAAIKDRHQALLKSLQSSDWHVESLNAITDSRLIIGLGGTSVIETGMTLHPLYGFPYLPGSGLKGLARAYAEIGCDASKEELIEIFGSEDKAQHSSNNRQGKVFFMDGLPTSFPKLDLDIMNPHYGDYYSGKKDSKGNPIPPADHLNPVPVTFLAVAAGQTFSFAVFSRDKNLAEKAKAWLIGGLTDLGAGGKTNVGYGYFKIDETTKSPAKDLPAAPIVDNSLPARIKKIKNSQTFTEFLKSIKTSEIETLTGSSFKDTETHIGFVGELEASEVSSEIKRIIAEKILQITIPNKKWDEKKHEKYKKLKAIAGNA